MALWASEPVFVALSSRVTSWHAEVSYSPPRQPAQVKSIVTPESAVVFGTGATFQSYFSLTG